MRTCFLPCISVSLLLIPFLAFAAPDTVASVRARAHAEIAKRDAQIAALQDKIAYQEKTIALLRGQAAQAKSSDSAPEENDAPFIDPHLTQSSSPHTLGLSPLQEAAADAIDRHDVSMTVSMTNIFGETAEVDFAVENLSKTPIQFYSIPTMYYGNGLYSKMKLMRVSATPMPTAVDQTMDIFAMASGPGRGNASGRAALPGEPPTAQNTVISPGETLYLRASCSVDGNDHIPTKFTFDGGGWDLYSLNVHVTP